MKSGFVLSLFGDDENLRRPKVLEDVDRWVRHKHRPEPRVVYAFGEENKRVLESRGIECEMIHPDPIVDFGGTGGERKSWGRGGYNYGWSIWRHKTEAMATAMEAFDEIVWLDWDCLQFEPLPADFWGRMRERRPIQITLVSYRHRHCHWRPRRIGGGRSVPEGAFVYCRDAGLIDEANRLYAEPDKRLWIDQMVFGFMIDRMMGGWRGEEAYRDEGFEPHCHRIRNQFFKPEIQLFGTLRGQSHGMWEAKRERRKRRAEARRKARELA